MATKRLTLGGVTDKLFDLREQRRKIAAEDKILKAEYDALELQLIDLLKQENSTKCAGSKASATVSDGFAYSFDGPNGFDLFMAFVAKHKYFHMVQRRMSAPAVEELFAKKGAVPGVAVAPVKSINLRVI